ncbi:MAG: RluA family pseudouridine synthase [Patescibacteria group bacterium]
MNDLTKSILYEDPDIVVINKPSGLVVHSDGRTKEDTVVDWVKEKYPEAMSVGEPIELKNGASIERPGIVHRIDRETSGILVIAKTEVGFDCLKAQFQNREIEKVYHLFAHGLVKEDRGSITRPIGKSSSDFRKWSAQRGAKGEMRDALTYFEVLKRSPELNVSFVEAKPKTGRTHQIRVHFQALQHPVIGDNLYAGGKGKLLGFERTALHARRIAFSNVSGEKIVVEAPYPEDFERAIAMLS